MSGNWLRRLWKRIQNAVKRDVLPAALPVAEARLERTVAKKAGKTAADLLKAAEGRGDRLSGD